MPLPLPDPSLAVVPVLTGPIQALLALLPWILLTLLGMLLSLFRPRVIWTGVRLLWRNKLTLAALGLVVFGGYSLWNAYAPELTGGEVLAAQRGGDWPMFRSGPARTGAVPGNIEPIQAKLSWHWKDGRTAVFSSPAVVGNRVYVSTALTGFGDGEGRILCLDADTGEPVWEAAPPGYRATFSSPVVAGNRLVCGEGLHTTPDARVVCLDLSPGREGELLWSYRTASHVECTPVVYGGKVYVGAGDDGFYCLELESDKNGKAKVVWHVDGEDYPDAETALAVHGGCVYAGLGWGGEAICVLDAETGRQLKRIATEYPVFSPPAIADGHLYVGMGNGDYVNTAEQLGMEPAGAVWCIDLATLEVTWKYPVGRTVLGSPAISDGRVYFCCRDGKLYCLATDGKPVGTFNTYAPLVTSPAVTGHLVLVVSESGVLYALERDSLQPRWEFRVSGGPGLLSSPAVARGRVFVGSTHDGLVAVGEPGHWSMQPDPVVWSGPLGKAGSCGNRDDSPLAKLGTMHWQYPADQEGQSEVAVVAAPAAAVEDELLVPLAGDRGSRGIVCLPADAAGQETPKPRWSYPTEHSVWRSAVICGDTVLAVEGRAGDEDRRLHAMDRRTGKPQWNVPVAADASGTLGCSEGEVFVQDAAKTLSCLTVGGNRVWAQTLGRIEHPPTPYGDLLVVTVSNPASLVVLDLATGKELWREELDAAPNAAGVVREQAVFVGTASRLEARSLLDGSPLAGWQCGGGGVSGAFFLGHEVVAYVSTEGELTLLSRQHGRLLGKCPGALPGFAPLPCRERLLVLGEEAILAVAFEDGGLKGKPQPWVDTSWLGRPTSSMVLAGGNVYVGMVGWGLVRLGAE